MADKKRLIVGIAHNGEEDEISSLKAIIDEHQPSKVGLELPEDYKINGYYGAYYPPFSELSTYSESKGITVIPLEDANLRVRVNQLEAAKAVLEGKIRKEDLERDLEKVVHIRSSSFNDVERFRAIRIEENYRGALAILEKTHGSLDKFMSLYAEFQNERERYFLEIIGRTQPNLIIIGFHHAEKLIDCLADYSYLWLHPPESQAPITK